MRRRGHVFDERFGIGCFEDDDYCRRAREAGFRTVVAEGTVTLDELMGML